MPDDLALNSQILANIREAVITTDMAGVVTYWNEGASRLFGCRSEDMLGRPLASRRACHCQAQPDLLGQRITQGLEWEGDWQDYRQDGSRILIEARVSKFRDTSGKVLGMLGVFHDVTAVRRAEADRDEALTHLRLQIECMPLAYILYDRELRYAGWNPAAERIFGLTQEEILGQPLLVLVAPEDRAAVTQISARLKTGDVNAHSVNRNVTKDGRIIWCEWHNTPLVDADGSFQGVLSMTSDVTARVEMEASLRQSEERLRLALAAAHMGMFDWDLKTDRVVCSASHYELFGYSPLDTSEVTSKHFSDRIHPEDLERVNYEVQNAIEQHLPFASEFRLALPDGSPRWVFGSGEFHYDQAGAAVRMLGTVIDTTKRKHAEAALRESEFQFRTFMHHLPAAAWSEDVEGRLLFANLHHGVMAGNPPGQRIAFQPAGGEATLATEASVAITQAYTKPDGTRGEAMVIRFPLKKEDGGIATGAVALDITERARLQAELVLQARAIQAVNQGIVVTDPNLPKNPIVYASPGFERITGYPAEFYLGRNCRFLQGPDTDRSEVARMADCIRRAVPYSGELLNYRKDGTAFWNEISISPVTDSAGRVVNFVGIQADVSARRNLEEQLRQAQKMEAVGQLAGGVAHDFNNLLTIINSYAELLLSETPTKDDLQESVSAILEAGHRAAKLTQQLLAFGRRAIVAPRVLDLNDIVEAICKMLRRLIGENIVLATSLTPKPCRANIDPSQLDQVIMNLAVNARDAMPGGGRLSVETFSIVVCAAEPDCPSGRYSALSVTDTGQGMTDEVKAHIFEPFFTTKGVGKGSGLGLAMVYGIVRQAGGCVRVESVPGEGTTFTILLPESPAPAPDQEDGGVTKVAPLTTGTILLAEDEELVRKLARRALEIKGYAVLEAASGVLALEVAAAHPGRIDLLVTDVVMPNMGGPELVAAIRCSRPALPVLYVSGYSPDLLLFEGLASEQDAFLQKPFTPQTLTSKVWGLLHNQP